MDGMRNLDSWITSGRYDSSQLDVTCSKCGEATAVLSETEYGTTCWTPEECPKCHTSFDGEESWCESEPPDFDIEYDPVNYYDIEYDRGI
jgi:hypothetical protein